MPRKEPLIGYLRGQYANGADALVSVHKAGGTYRLSGPGRSHLCRPSVQDIEDVKHEAFQVYGVWNSDFEPV